MNAEEILSVAIEKNTPAARSAYLKGACGQDAALRASVERLLIAHDQAGSFLEQPLFRSSPGATSPPEKPGTVVGPYKLLQQIGEGGMGTVFMAEQTHPVRRKVALKIIKPGVVSAQSVARFEAERQALALMDHPNIARVLEAGTIGATNTAAEAPPLAGRPYFVMELVKGVPITKYCDEHHLTPKQRLELFVPVCQAVQHAHQKGIIHRDLKPSNVLIAPCDGRPVPKVIDFGVAKAMGVTLTERTMFTEFGQLVGTLEYMSPEQAELNHLDVDTRSDIYSLGVLLYELLTGTTPLERSRLEGTSFPEMLRLIREEEPPKPSTRLSTTEETSGIAANRGLVLKRLSGLVRGELDWIVMRCLEKDRGRRYETANGLAMDLERYLSDEPVLAGPPSASYRFRKFARRHKSGLAIAAVILFSTVLLGGGVGWTLRDRATRQAATEQAVGLALDDAKRFQDAGNLPEALSAARRAEGLLAGGVGPQDFRRRVQQRRADLEMALRLEDIRLEKSAVKDGAFDLASADRAYAQAFREYGIEVDALSVDEAAQLIRARSVTGELAASLIDWACCGGRADDSHLLLIALAADPDPERESIIDAGRRGDRARLAELAGSAAGRTLPPKIVEHVSCSLLDLGAVQEAVDLLREAQRRHPGDFFLNGQLAASLMRLEPPKAAEALRFYTAAVAIRPQSPGAHLNVGGVLAKLGEHEEAVAAFREAIRLKPDYAEAHANLGVALRKKGLLDDAVAAYREATRVKPGYAEAYACLGSVLREKGLLDDAIAAYREAIRLKPDYAEAYYVLAYALTDKGLLDEAVAAWREAIRFRPDCAEAYINLGHALTDMGCLDDAIAACREAIRLKPDDALAHVNLGNALCKKGLLDDAVAAYREAIRLEPDDAMAYVNLGGVLQDKGLLDEAVAACREAIRLKPDFGGAYGNLGRALTDKGLLDEAIAAYREAIRLKADVAMTYYNLGNALQKKGLLDEAVAAYREAVRLKPDFADAYGNLGSVLREKGFLDDAVAAHREEIRLEPGDALAYVRLGVTLECKGLLEEAAAAYREAIRLKPDCAEAYNNLGNALQKKGLLDGAIAAYREAIRLRPDLAKTYYSLGNALRGKGLLDDAIAAYREAVRLDCPDAYGNLGVALLNKGLLDEAVEALREAIRLKPDDARAYSNLGAALLNKGLLDDAIAAFREAIRLEPDQPLAHCNLGHVLRIKGSLPEALAALRKGHELGSRRPDWKYPSAQWVEECERMVALEESLPAFLSGEVQPADTRQAIDLASLCYAKTLHGASARFWRDAFTLDPLLAEDLAEEHRYSAACAAALAGCGAGKDAKALDAKARAEWRAQARAWLSADLDLRRKQLETDRHAVGQKLQHWRADPDFAGVRDRIDKLPPGERGAWRALWKDVDETLARAQEAK